MLHVYILNHMQQVSDTIDYVLYIDANIDAKIPVFLNRYAHFPQEISIDD